MQTLEFRFASLARTVLQAGLILVASTSYALPPQITLIDESGKTQSAVELKPDGTADISATLSYGNERLVPAGVRVSLLKAAGKEFKPVAVATSEKNGEVLFSKVSEGTYKLKIACDEYKVAKVDIPGRSTADDDSGGGSDSLETLTIQDVTGVSRVVQEVPPGQKNTVLLKTESTSDNGFAGVKARLVSIENGARSDVAADAAVDKNGEATFKSVNTGTYQVEFDCQSQTQAVSIAGKGVLSVLCPVTIGG